MKFVWSLRAYGDLRQRTTSMMISTIISKLISDVYDIYYVFGQTDFERE